MKTINADALSEEVWAMARKVRTREMQTVLMAIDRLIHATENVREFEWVSMDEAKPDKAGTYLVYRGYAATTDWLDANNPDWLVGTGFWNEDGEFWYGSLAKANIDKTVTHWMPMPTAPEGWG